MEHAGDVGVCDQVASKDAKISVINKDDDTNFDSTLQSQNQKHKFKTKRGSDSIHRYKSIRKFFKYPENTAKIFREKFNSDKRNKKLGIQWTVPAYSEWGKRASKYTKSFCNVLHSCLKESEKNMSFCHFDG